MTSWKKESIENSIGREKMLVSNIFSFCYVSIFPNKFQFFNNRKFVVSKMPFQIRPSYNFLFGKEVTISQTNHGFLLVCSIKILKTLWEKEKLLIKSNFSFSHSVFYPFGELLAIFIKLVSVICKLFWFGPVQNLSFGKGSEELQVSMDRCTG